DGLIHISELSWSHVNHPSEILDIGDTVSVKVLDIDRDRQRISLGLKQTQEDPWQTVLNEYGEGDTLDGTVTKVVQFGAFVQILPGVEGLVHISELAQHHVESPGEVVAPGDEVRVKILEVDEERRRLSLSVKRVEGQELPIKAAMDAAKAQVAEATPEEMALAEAVQAPAEPSEAEPEAEAEPVPAEQAAEVEAAPDLEPAPPPEAEAPVEDPPVEVPPAEDPPAEEPPPEEPPAEEPPAEEPAAEEPAAEEPAAETPQEAPEPAEGS
ncbi:MAG: small subunit ribosomal protein, partial [Solirubrobacterales bacterium]|nr:small subunit ribosomal protein [Solirubrobacterales bacterium]